MKIASYVLVSSILIFSNPAWCEDLTDLQNQVRGHGASIVKDFASVKLNAGQCGFIGSQISTYMDEAAANVAAQVKRILAKMEKRDKRALQREMEAREALNAKNDPQIPTALFGLSTQNAPCMLARKRFLSMHATGKAMDKLLKKIIDSLDSIPAGPAASPNDQAASGSMR